MSFVINKVIQDFMVGDKDHRLCQQTKDEMMALTDTAATVHNGLIVEIGRRFGGSMVLLALSSPTSQIISIDPSPTYLKDAIKLAEKYEVMDRCTLIVSQSQVVHKWQYGAIDLLFIDGNHALNAAYKDLKLWVPRVKTQGSIMMHDIGHGPYAGIRTCTKALQQYLQENTNLQPLKHTYTLWIGKKTNSSIK